MSRTMSTKVLCDMTNSSVHLHQLFDTTSSTFTYLISCEKSKECILIDPVLEQIDRDTTLIKSLGLKLTHAINTHCHADHVTSTGTLQSSYDFKTLISKNSGAKADILLNGNKEFIHWGINQKLQVLSTPGHTSGCISLYEATLGVFTGDALMINGCGRTDFQDGDSEQLYDSVHEQLFTLPLNTVVYPAHDYNNKTSSTIGIEKESNSRLSQSKKVFVEIMNNLNLPYPAKIDIAVPLNLRCGV